MGLYDSFQAELTCPNCGCQAMVAAQTKEFENAMLTFSIGETIDSLGQAEFRGVTVCKWCKTSVEVPVVVREGRFLGFGEATVPVSQPIPQSPPPLKNPAQAGPLVEAVQAVQERYPGEVYLGWESGHYSIAVWHRGQWLHASWVDNIEGMLRQLAEEEADRTARHRMQRIEDALLQRAGVDPHKRLPNWGMRTIDRAYLQDVERQLLAVLQSIGVGFADLTVTARGKVCLSANGTSAESIFHQEIADTVANLLRNWVRAEAGIDRRIGWFREEDRRVTDKTLARLEDALGLDETSP